MAARLTTPYRVKINWKEVDRLLMCGCEGTEIAERIGCNAETIYRRCQEEHGIGFTQYMQLKRAKGASLVREAQYDEAVRKRNTTMLVWVGKQLCKQTEKENLNINGGAPIQVISYNGQELQPWKEPNKDEPKIPTIQEKTEEA